MEKFLVLNRYEALAFGFSEEEIEEAEKSKDGLIGEKKYPFLNQGRVNCYISKMLPTHT